MNACRPKAAGLCCRGGAPRDAKGFLLVDKKVSERFPHSHRIVRTNEYRNIYSTGKKIHSGNFVLFYQENHCGHPRLGITVSRKIGCASVRNRTKRLFREVFRRSLTHIPENLDLVVNAKSGCVGIRYRELCSEFITAANKAVRAKCSKGTRTNVDPLPKQNKP